MLCALRNLTLPYLSLGYIRSHKKYDLALHGFMDKVEWPSIDTVVFPTCEKKRTT